MLPNHTSFPAIEEENFLLGSRLLVSLSKLKSPHYEAEFKRDCRKYLENLITVILSTVAARSPSASGLSCFCRKSSLAVTTSQPSSCFSD